MTKDFKMEGAVVLGMGGRAGMKFGQGLEEVGEGGMRGDSGAREETGEMKYG